MTPPIHVHDTVTRKGIVGKVMEVRKDYGEVIVLVGKTDLDRVSLPSFDQWSMSEVDKVKKDKEA